MTTLIYTAIRAALLFVPLHEIPEGLEAFLEHLDRSHEKIRPKQIDLFQKELRLAPARGPPPAADPSRTPGSGSPAQVPAPRPLGLRIAREAWRVTTFVYGALRAALLFVPLHEIPAHLEAFLEHLERSGEKVRPKQIERFLKQLTYPRS